MPQSQAGINASLVTCPQNLQQWNPHRYIRQCTAPYICRSQEGYWRPVSQAAASKRCSLSVVPTGATFSWQNIRPERSSQLRLVAAAVRAASQPREGQRQGLHSGGHVLWRRVLVRMVAQPPPVDQDSVGLRARLPMPNMAHRGGSSRPRSTCVRCTGQGAQVCTDLVILPA